MEKIDRKLLHLFLTEPIYLAPEPGDAPLRQASFETISASIVAAELEPGATAGKVAKAGPVLASALSRKAITLPGHGTMPLPAIAGGILLLVHYPAQGPLPADEALMLGKIAEAMNFGPGSYTIEIGDVRRFAIAPGLAGCLAAVVIVLGAPEASVAGMGLTPMQKRYAYGNLNAIAMPSAHDMVASAPLRKLLWEEIKGLKR